MNPPFYDGLQKTLYYYNNANIALVKIVIQIYNCKMKKCSETDEIFSLLRTVLHSGTENLIIGDPGLLFTQMKEQSVAALPGQLLKDHPLPGTEQWLIFCARQQAQWIRIMHAQEELLNLLEANGIPCVIIKGAAAAMAYPYPALRSMGDVDFLVKRCDYELAAALLEENGYRLAHDKNPAAHHYGYRKDRIASYTLSVTGIDSFFKRLQEGGLSRWKAAKRFALLRPFAWIYKAKQQSTTSIGAAAPHGCG